MRPLCKLRQKEGKEAGGQQRLHGQPNYRGWTIYNNQGPYACPSRSSGAWPTGTLRNTDTKHMTCHDYLGLPGSPAWVGTGWEESRRPSFPSHSKGAQDRSTIVSALSTCTEVILQRKTVGLRGSQVSWTFFPICPCIDTITTTDFQDSLSLYERNPGSLCRPLAS